MLGCVAGRRTDGPRGWLVGFLIGHVYALYTWLLWPVLARSSLRQVTKRRDWSKTHREPLDAAAPRGTRVKAAAPTSSGAHR